MKKVGRTASWTNEIPDRKKEKERDISIRDSNKCKIPKGCADKKCRNESKDNNYQVNFTK